MCFDEISRCILILYIDHFITRHIYFFLQYELIYQVLGRSNFNKITANLDLFLRRFNEVQYWVVTEMVLAQNVGKRVQLLRKFIKVAAQYVHFLEYCVHWIKPVFKNLEHWTHNDTKHNLIYEALMIEWNVMTYFPVYFQLQRIPEFTFFFCHCYGT